MVLFLIGIIMIATNRCFIYKSKNKKPGINDSVKINYIIYDTIVQDQNNMIVIHIG